jgi:hypothetical protein
MAKKISLTRWQIDTAIESLGEAVQKYSQLQQTVRPLDREFQRKFNGYYRVRRGPKWQKDYYDAFEENQDKSDSVNFEEVLIQLHKVTGRMEASFVSKLVGTIRPELPIIDSVVLGHLDLRLPAVKTENRVAKIKDIYQKIAQEFEDYLQSDDGKYLVERFQTVHKTTGITPVKMLDFVLWKTR